LTNMVPCVLDAFTDIIGSLASQLCNQAPTPAERIECLETFANLTAELSGGLSGDFPTDAITDSINQLCLQNPANGIYCYGSMLSLGDDLPNPGDVADAENCPLLNSLGCCATGLTSLVTQFDSSGSGSCSSPLPFTPSEFTAALASCTFQTGLLNAIPACPAPGVAVKIVRATWTLTGLLIGGINALTPAKRAELAQALAEDFAVLINLPAASRIFISIGSITAIPGGSNVAIVWVMRGPTDIVTTGFDALVKVFLTSATAGTFPATTTFAGDNAGVAGPTVGLDKATSTSAVETQTGTSDASSLSASMAVLVAMLIAMMMRF